MSINHRIFKSVSGAAIIVSMAFIAMPMSAFAQSDEAGNSVRDTITVTAQRREESLQDVPVAITALGAADLENRQIRDVNDLQNHIPNAVISTGTGTASSARIFFRGIGEDESRGAIDPAVGIYVDGVYLGRTVGSLVDLVDIERVEVLRGPQGTLYGRNTNGGAIKIISTKPQIGENSLDAEVGFGSNQRFSAKGSANISLGDSTALRVSGLQKYRDGFFTVTPNGPLAGQNQTNVGKEQVFAIKGSLYHEFNADWSALISADYTDDNTDPTPSSIIAQSDDPSVVTDVDNNQFTVEPTGTCSGAPQIFQAVGCFVGFNSGVEAFGASLKLDGTIGNFDVSSISAYRTLDDELSTHITFPFSQTTDQAQFSQEVTLSSNFEGPFNFLSGVYYYDEDVQLDSVFFFPFSVEVDTQSFAVFGQGTYDLTDQLTLTGGIRYTNENRDFSGTSGAPGVASLAFPQETSVDVDNFTYTGKIDYSLTDEILVYGSYSTGFKSPGFSPDCFAVATCFLPVTEESLDAFEAGLRSEWLDGALQFNATYFYNNYDDLQIGGTLPTGGFTRINAGEARIQGIEVETNWFPAEGLNIYANASWLDAEYQNLTAFQAGLLTGTRTDTGTPGPTCSNVTAAAGTAAFDQQIIDCGLGLDLKNAPEFKATIGFTYNKPVAAGNLTLGGDLAYEDSSFGLVANTPGALIEPGVRINARIGYQPDHGTWRIAVWGKNLTDREYFRATTGANQVYPAAPLTWGVDLGVSF